MAFVLILIDESMILFSEMDCLSLKCRNIGGRTNVRFVFIASFIEIVRQTMWVILKVDNESYNNLEGHIDYLYVPKLPKEKKKK